MEGERREIAFHLRGVPWQMVEPDLLCALSRLLPASCCVTEVLLPLDKRARRTSHAFVRFAYDETPANSAEIATSLDSQKIEDEHPAFQLSAHLSSRLSSRLSSPVSAQPISIAELAAQRRKRAAISARMRPLSPQAFQTKACAASIPTDPRDVVIVCRVPPHVGAGQIQLNQLPSGRVDLLARCVSASLFVSFGLRPVCVWIVLGGSGLTLCCRGESAEGLHPDERTLASAMRRTLLSEQAGGRGVAPLGWSVHEGDEIDTLLPRLLNSTREGALHPPSSQEVCLLVLDEAGDALPSALASQTKGNIGRTVLVVGGHQGFTTLEQQAIDDCVARFGGLRVRVSPIPLLASHCIVLAHAALDEHHLAQE